MRRLDKVLIGCIMVLLAGTMAWGQVADGSHWVTWDRGMKAAYVLGCFNAAYFMMGAVEAETGLKVEWLTCYRGMAASGDDVETVVKNVDFFYSMSQKNWVYPVYMVVLQYEFVMSKAYQDLQKGRW